MAQIPLSLNEKLTLAARILPPREGQLYMEALQRIIELEEEQRKYQDIINRDPVAYLYKWDTATTVVLRPIPQGSQLAADVLGDKYEEFPLYSII